VGSRGHPLEELIQGDLDDQIPPAAVRVVARSMATSGIFSPADGVEDAR